MPETGRLVVRVVLIVDRLAARSWRKEANLSDAHGRGLARSSAQPGAAGDGANSDALRLAELFRTPIDDLELSVRSVNSLKNSNIRSLGDLVRQTEAQILQVKNFGKKSLQEIAALLEKEGLNFGMRYEESVDGVRILDMGTAPSRAAENAPDDDDDED